MLLTSCQSVWKHSEEQLQQCYMNESKFNSKNRIFLSSTEGKLRTASVKFMIKTPKFCSWFTSEECLLSERRSTWWLLLSAFKSILLLPPQSWPYIYSNWGQVKEAGGYLYLGWDCQVKKGKNKKPEKVMIWDPRGTSHALPSPLSPVYIFIASHFQFTGSPRYECQIGRCDKVENSEKWNALGSLF